jgi:hypothetical protein
MPVNANVKWHGWIVREEMGPGLKPSFKAEWNDSLTGQRMYAAHSTDPAQVIEFWDDKVGEKVKLLSTPLGAYRVYTGTLEEDVG